MSDDSPWKDQPAYLDVGYSRGRDTGGDAGGDNERGYFRGGTNLDLDSESAMEVGMKGLIIWPLVFLLLGVLWSINKVETAPETAAPQQVVEQSPVTPPQPPAVTNPPERGHWVWYPDKGPANAPPGTVPSYSIPAAPRH